MRTSTCFATALLATLSLAACSAAPAPAPADTTNDATAREAERHHELKDAVEAKGYTDKVGGAADAVMEADAARDRQLEDSGG